MTKRNRSTDPQLCLALLVGLVCCCLGSSCNGVEPIAAPTPYLQGSPDAGASFCNASTCEEKAPDLGGEPPQRELVEADGGRDDEATGSDAGTGPAPDGTAVGSAEDGGAPPTSELRSCLIVRFCGEELYNEKQTDEAACATACAGFDVRERRCTWGDKVVRAARVSWPRDCCPKSCYGSLFPRSKHGTKRSRHAPFTYDDTIRYRCHNGHVVCSYEPSTGPSH